MYSVSNAYKLDIENTVRNPSYMRVRFGIVDPQARDDSTISDTSSAPFSNSTNVKIETDLAFRYDTLEWNQFILDNGKHKLGSSGYGDYQGYVSGVVSDASGYFTTNPKLIITYPSDYSFSGVSLNFDEIRGDYCSELNIKAFDGVAKVFDIDYTNNSVYFVGKDGLPTHDRIEVTFIRTSTPYKRVKVSYFGFGITETYTDSVITNAEQARKVDILSTYLPTGDFQFTFLDINNEYNPENPSGLYAYLEQLQPVKFEYGYELNDGSIEWMVGGNNYTTGEIDFDSNGVIPSVTIKTTNTLAFLDEVYRNGVYNPTGVTLYNLAVSVLSGQSVLYELDASLNNIITKSPLPVDTVRNCLQIIANAGLCTLDVDRSGKIIIKKNYALVELVDVNDSIVIDSLDQTIYTVENDGQTQFKFSKENTYNTPVVSKIPPLKNVTASYRTYTVASTTSELGKVDVVSPVSTTYFLDYELASTVSISVNGTLTIQGSPTYYAYGCTVTLTGSGTVTITGKKITVTETQITRNFGANGVDCVVKNELLTTATDVKNYINWIGEVLLLTNEYTVENRGYPELDPMDKIYLETLYTPNQSVILTENRVSYNGAIKSNSKMIIGT